MKTVDEQIVQKLPEQRQEMLKALDKLTAPVMPAAEKKK